MTSTPRTSLLTRFKNFLRLDDPAARRLAMEIGLVRTHTGFTRFIILGRSRTGSNFLRGLLSSHPAALTLGEVFRNEETIDFDHPDFPCTPQVLQLYQSDPAKFLEAVVYRRAPVHVQAVGFKLFYYHARTQPYRALWETLEQQPEIHVLHIKRRNILHTHLSRENAEKSGSWVNTSGKNEKHHAVRLDYEECLLDFMRTREWENQADQFFDRHPILQVDYDDLASNTSQVIAQVQDFLGLEKAAVTPRTYKQSRRSLSEAILNYTELKNQFSGTPWAEFFNE